ncbi:MAG: alpha/beta hydrolase-fold protein [Alphaproteobacteria bacterium]|nr:alpha/beta hydrolase-fold protein [Alphaproteobacteria bacterium]
MHNNYVYPNGTIHRLIHQSDVLKKNPLHDPVQRALHVYLPHGKNRKHHLPLLVDLAGYGNSGPGHTSWKAFGENLPERLDRLISEAHMPPVVVAFPDCYTCLGGNQYINSAGTGRYADYLIEEIVPLVEQEFNCGGLGQRGVFGKSSGGFGALWHGMHYPDFWSAIASCAGDAAFEIVYLPDIYAAAQTLTDYDLSITHFIASTRTTSRLSQQDRGCLMVCAMAATYDPVYNHGIKNEPVIRLPIDLKNGRLIPERWQNWLNHDPAIIVTERLEKLRQLKGIWLECGRHDQFNLQFGTYRISDALTQAGIKHVYEEFNGGHSQIDHRLDHFLPWLAKTIIT